MTEIEPRTRPPFIWIASQPIDPVGFMATMRDAPPRNEGQNRWVLMRREFKLQACPENAAIEITVDGRYQLFVNGEMVGRGPVRSSFLDQKYDRYEVSARLREGDNVIAVLVHVYGADTAWYERVRGMWQPTFGDGGLWLRSVGINLMSDLKWRALESEAWDRDTLRMNDGLGFIESLDARRLPVDWKEADFDDADWEDVHILRSGGDGPESFFGGLVTKPFPYLSKSPLPALTETLERPTLLRWAKRVADTSEKPASQASYEASFLDGAPEISDIDQLTSGGTAVVRTLPNQGVSLLFGFDGLLTAYPHIELDAKGGEIIDIAVAEKLPGEFSPEGMSDDARITPAPVLGNDAHVARYIARPGPQTFERFEWSAVKWMQVTIWKADEGLKIKDIAARFIRYPAGEAGSFTCSDPFLSDLWSIGRKTVQLCMHDGWEDCPSREQRQWLGDVTVEHLAAQTAFGPQANPLTAKYLRDVAASQRPDGLTQMFAPGDHKVNGILIPDWTLQWILTASDYYLWSGDLETIDGIFPAIQRALQWFERQRGPSGLVADMPYWHFMDWSGVGRSGEAGALNAQYAGTLRAAAKLAAALEYDRAAVAYRRDADMLASALNERHWDERRGAYVDIVDPETGEQNLRVSQHTNAGMILWDLAPQDRWDRMIDRTTDAERLTFTAAPPIAPTGETLDPEDGVVLANTFYAHFVYSALAKAGRLDLAITQFRRRLGPMLERGADTLWESLEPTASLCHGFSASPTYQLSTALLGVTPSAPGFTSFDFHPQLVGVESASGTLETVAGSVSVSLEDKGDRVEAIVDVPDGSIGHMDESKMRLLEGSARLEPGRNRLVIAL
ncbi:MAG: alpha-L-rhamnosidase N-terminal domain-containing protein [Pacificimonas sp.]